MFLRLLAAIAAILLVSCSSTQVPMPRFSAYRIEIQQGNFVSQEMVSQLKPGMSKDQVRFVLGTPLIADGFHADRWDYVFRRQRANSSELEQRKFAVFFEGGKLKRVEGDVTPAANTQAAGVDATAAKSEAQMEPVPATVQESGPAGQTEPDAAKPAQVAAPENPTAAPLPSGDKLPE